MAVIVLRLMMPPVVYLLPALVKFLGNRIDGPASNEEVINDLGPIYALHGPPRLLMKMDPSWCLVGMSDMHLAGFQSFFWV